MPKEQGKGGTMNGIPPKVAYNKTIQRAEFTFFRPNMNAEIIFFRHKSLGVNSLKFFTEKNSPEWRFTHLQYPQRCTTMDRSH